jgi:hypothetical protein
MKKTWYTIKDGKIGRVQITRENEKPLPENLDWKLSPTNNVLHEETPIERYDANMRYLNDDEWLKKQGRKDNRGRWYHKEKIGETILIYGLDETVDENKYTREAPIEKEPYQIFDETENKWVIDNVKKTKAEKENRLGKLKSDVEDAERRQIRPLKAIIKNEATEADTKTFNKYEEIINELRPQITALEDELKSA